MELTGAAFILPAARMPTAGEALALALTLLVPALAVPPEGRVDVPAMSCVGVLECRRDRGFGEWGRLREEAR